LQLLTLLTKYNIGSAAQIAAARRLKIGCRLPSRGSTDITDINDGEYSGSERRDGNRIYPSDYLPIADL
jgi:hypothetical protein